MTRVTVSEPAKISINRNVREALRIAARKRAVANVKG